MCLEWHYWYPQPVSRAAWATLLAEGHLPFCLSNKSNTVLCLSSSTENKGKNYHPATAGASLLLSDIAAVAMAAVVAVGRCSGGPPPPHLLFPLPQKHQAAPMSAAGSFTAFPGEHLISPHPGTSAVAWPFC